MSLINKMLQDLEARETPTGGGTPVYRDLRPVGAARDRGPRRLVVVSVAVLILGAAIYFAADRIGFALIPPMPKTSKPAISPAAPPMAKVESPVPARQSPVSASAVTTTPVVAMAPVADPATPVSEMPPAGVSSPEQPAPAPKKAHKPKAAVTTAAAVVSPKPKRQTQVVVPPPPTTADSQKSAQVSIVKAKEPTPAPVHKGERESAAARSTPPSRTAEPAKDAERFAVVDKKVRPMTAEEKAEADYRRAVRFLDQGRPDDAMTSLREALAAQPTHAKARELAAGLALQGGHWRDAQSLLEEGLRQLPSHYPFARLLARVYVDHGAEAKALAVMESAEPQGSDDPDFSSLLGLLYQRAGRYADAVKVYERSLQIRPDDARSWLGFAISLEGTEQWAAAKNAYQRAKDTGGLTPRLMQYADQRLAALGKH